MTEDDLVDFEDADVWERIERRRRCVLHVAIGAGFTAVLVAILYMARYMGGKPQSQFSVVCDAVKAELAREPRK